MTLKMALTRTAALTGRLSVRAGMYKVGFPPEGSGLHRDEVTIAEVLGQQGYVTGFVGKAHQGDTDQSALLMKDEGFSRRDYYHVYIGDVLAAFIKQQIKRDWTNDRPGLVSDDLDDLYRDPREEYGDMPPYLWAWPAFDHMKARRERQMTHYPNRSVTRGVPYEGVENLRHDARAIAERMRKYDLVGEGDD